PTALPCCPTLQSVHGVDCLSRPETSIIRNTFMDHIPRRITRLTQAGHNLYASLQTLEGYSRCISAVAFSLDG
ncbi:hypothetical protein K432DRAFT_473318, partial [Lepidopterella palustris CBS 459.81]